MLGVRSVWREQIFAVGVQPVGNTLGRESDGGKDPSNNRCQVSFLLAHAELFSLMMPRVKIRLRIPASKDLRIDIFVGRTYGNTGDAL